MSYDVWLELDNPIARQGTGIFVREDGCAREVSREEWFERWPNAVPVVAQATEQTTSVYSANITHNLGKMAVQFGLYEAMWRPEGIGASRAFDLIEPLSSGLERLRADPDRARTFNAENGWGKYENLLKFAEEYLAACQAYPTATVGVSR